MKANKYLINLARGLWFWFWMRLMDGFAPSDRNGNYKRPKGLNFNLKLNYILDKKASTYLLVGKTCPWCHRTLILLKLLNLSEEVKIIFLEPDYLNGEWIFKESFYKFKKLNKLYQALHNKEIFRATLPLLIKNKDEKLEIVTNESSEIIKVMHQSNNRSDFQKSMHIGDCDKEFLNFINRDINNGVYKCGFARNQNSYRSASEKLFEALNTLEKILKDNEGPFLLGKDITIADIYLFPTMIRWELIYSKLFKCTAQEFSEFKNIIKWRFNFYNLDGISETCFEESWAEDYFKALFPLNPNQIVPIQPSLEEILAKS